MTNVVKQYPILVRKSRNPTDVVLVDVMYAHVCDTDRWYLIIVEWHCSVNG